MVREKMLYGTNRKRSDWLSLIAIPCDLCMCVGTLRATWDEQPVHFEITKNEKFVLHLHRVRKEDFMCDKLLNLFTDAEF